MNAAITMPASAYRVYDESALKRLRFIKQAQALGFALDEIKRILGLRGQGIETCRCVIRIAEATLSETEEHLRELQQFQVRLKQAVALWKRNTVRRRNCRAEFCHVIEKIEMRGAPPERRKLDRRIPRNREASAK